MPSTGGKQTSPEMLKRATLTEPSFVKHKKTRSGDRTRYAPSSVKRKKTRLGDRTRVAKTGNHVANPHPLKSSHVQYSQIRDGSSHRQRENITHAKKGKPIEQSLDSSDSCVTDDTPAAGSIGPELVVSDAPDDDSASSSSAAAGLKISNLESGCAGLRISPDCSSKSSLQEHKSPREDVPEDSLPTELVHGILGRLPWRFALQLRLELGRDFRDSIHHPAFLRSRPRAEDEFSPSFFTTDAAGDLHWHGFDTKSRKWGSLPSLNFAKTTVLPSPDPDLFKDYLVAGDGGLLCLNVGKPTGPEKLVMCNPLTQQVKVLPPLIYSRHPVLMHLKVDDTGDYKVVVAGSAAIGTEDLSLKTEEYDSRTGRWECPENSDLPCPPFGLNEYQNGAYYTDSDRELLLCVAIIDTRGRGVLVYDIKKKKWVQGLTRFHIPLVRSEPNIGYLATTQIVECGGSVYVFSEQECGREVFFLIHKLNLDGPGDKPWDELMRRKRTGGRGLLVYPEFTCVAVSEHELCIFNTVEHSAEIIDLNKPTEVALLLPAPRSKANRFHSLNPIGFLYRPSFKSVVCPRGRNPDLRCKLDFKSGEYCSVCEQRDSTISGLRKNDGPTEKKSPDVAEKKEGAAAAQSNAQTQTAPESGVSKKGVDVRTENQCGRANEESRNQPAGWGGSSNRVPVTGVH